MDTPETRYGELTITGHFCVAPKQGRMIREEYVTELPDQSTKARFERNRQRAAKLVAATAAGEWSWTAPRLRGNLDLSLGSRFPPLRDA